jgi:hypothetical protein
LLPPEKHSPTNTGKGFGFWTIALAVLTIDEGSSLWKKENIVKIFGQ